MHLIDWLVLISTLLFIVTYGTVKTKGKVSMKDYIKGGEDGKWWTIGLSVMATQASAITFLSTPGQAFHSGMGFVQFYFGLPIAMIIVCAVFIPMYHRFKVYTAYDLLEQRFDSKTRTLTALLFLMQRGFAAGITIFAPSIILSAILGWSLTSLNIFIGVLVTMYTVSGGTKAVSETQKQQMGVIFFGISLAFILAFNYLPKEASFSNVMEIAGASGKLDILDFSFDLQNRYTVWSGLLGGTFLMLSYFGTDQSQVQRYLSGKTVQESQKGMIFNGLLKVPMQFFILLVGVMIFVFYQFNPSPLHFNPKAEQVVLHSNYSNEYELLQSQQQAVFKEKQRIHSQYIVNQQQATTAEQSAYQQLIADLNEQEEAIRKQAKTLITKADATVEVNDKDYIFIYFILNNLPRGIIGLLIAVIICAAMSSTASELNALATTTAIDIMRVNSTHSDAHCVTMTKWFTAGWGLIAIFIACVANLFDNLIQLVNIIGSLFYGNVLGVFLLAFFFKFVKGNAVFFSALLTQILIFMFYYFFIFRVAQMGGTPAISYLWLNLIGCILILSQAVLFSISQLWKIRDK